MAELFFFLAILIQCGLFPMSPDSCRETATPPPAADANQRALAAPESP